jgi:hypothetical protein
LQAGDVLFTAARMPLDLTQKPPFEHVVITAESRLIDRPEDFLELPVYGMPESSPDPTYGYSRYHGCLVCIGFYCIITPGIQEWEQRAFAAMEMIFLVTNRIYIYYENARNEDTAAVRNAVSYKDQRISELSRYPSDGILCR